MNDFLIDILKSIINFDFNLFINAKNITYYIFRSNISGEIYLIFLMTIILYIIINNNIKIFIIKYMMSEKIEGYIIPIKDLMCTLIMAVCGPILYKHLIIKLFNLFEIKILVLIKYQWDNIVNDIILHDNAIDNSFNLLIYGLVFFIVLMLLIIMLLINGVRLTYSITKLYVVFILKNKIRNATRIMRDIIVLVIQIMFAIIVLRQMNLYLDDLLESNSNTNIIMSILSLLIVIILPTFINKHLESYYFHNRIRRWEL